MGRGVHLDDVHRAAFIDADARRALVTRLGGGAILAVERLRKESGGRGLAGPTGAAEEVCMADLALTDGVLKGPGDVILADHVLERLRAVFAVECDVRHASTLWRPGTVWAVIVVAVPLCRPDRGRRARR